MESYDIYCKLVKLYNSKFKRLPRQEFCEEIGIEYSNVVSYNKIISILKKNTIIEVIDGERRNKIIKIDRNKLERFIRKTDQYKLTENFIHASNWGAIT